MSDSCSKFASDSPARALETEDEDLFHCAKSLEYHLPAQMSERLRGVSEEAAMWAGAACENQSRGEEKRKKKNIELFGFRDLALPGLHRVVAHVGIVVMVRLNVER